MKKILEYGLVILCLIPLFSINIKSSHDWGDDFAQYIHQAKNINEGISQNETGYILNENNFTAPVAYPIGFPIILSPILKYYGLDFVKFNQLETLFLILSCLVGFILIRQYFSFFTAFFSALIIAYNPTFLQFKTEIISDLPFTFFSVLCLLMFQKKENLLLNILLGVLLAFTVHLRSIGQLLIIVYILQKLFIEKPIYEFKIKEHKNSAVTLLTFLILYIVIKTIWPCNTNYPSLFETENFWLSFNDHFSYNIHHLSFLFKDYSTKNFYSIGIIASSAIVVFALTGMFHFYKLKSNIVYFYYFLFYCFVIFAFKLSHQGLRLLYPVIFFILLFAIFGIKKNLESVFLKQKWLAVLFGVLLLYSYQTEFDRIKNQTNDILDGPFKKESQEVFNFINTQIPKKSVIAFDKPRALALFCEVQSFAFYPIISDEEIENDIKKFKAEYYLTNETQSTEAIKNHPLKDKVHYELLFTNELFKLFKIKYQ